MPPKKNNLRPVSIQHRNNISNDELDNLKKGDYVKLSNSRDRFWVEVKEVKNNFILGVVANKLVSPDNYDFGDLIKFKKNNIIEIS
jgi:uncharacterized protein YegJ (DUF2314 family)